MESRRREDITRLVARLGDRRGDAADRLLPLVYDELRALAAQRVRQAPAGGAAALQPTEIVHEAYLRMVDQSRLDEAGRTHFFAIAATVIRNVLVDDARRRAAAKRGGEAAVVSLQEGDAAEATPPIDLVALDDALGRLAELDARQARIVELRFFGGLTCDEVAGVLDLSRRTVQGDWKMARSWLRHELGDA